MIPGTNIPENAVEAAVQRLEGTARSYVSNAKKRATIEHLNAQYNAAKRANVPEEMIKAVIWRGAATTMSPDPSRVQHVFNLFLAN